MDPQSLDDALTHLATGVGTWEGEEHLPPSPWMPDGLTARARAEARLGLGGHALIADSRQLANDGTVHEEHSVITWDPGSDQYLLHWFSGLSAHPTVLTGSRHANGFRFSGPAAGGGEIRRFIRFGDDVMHVWIETSASGQEWTTTFEGVYRRTATAGT